MSYEVLCDLINSLNSEKPSEIAKRIDFAGEKNVLLCIKGSVSM